MYLKPLRLLDLCCKDCLKVAGYHMLEDELSREDLADIWAKREAILALGNIGGRLLPTKFALEHRSHDVRVAPYYSVNRCQGCGAGIVLGPLYDGVRRIRYACACSGGPALHEEPATNESPCIGPWTPVVCE